MYDDGVEILFGLLAALLLGALVGFLIGISSNVRDDEAVCTYLHGKYHGDVCIVDGKVVSTKP